MALPISLYFHIPFCKARCRYCDFNTWAGMQDRIPAYFSAMEYEIRWASGVSPDRDVKTLFFGGGTPSLIPSAYYTRLLHQIYTMFSVQDDAEISLEANPGTVSPAELSELRRVGFNRISFGMQSAAEPELKMLGRIHTHLETVEAARQARRAGFENLNLDLIYGLPGQQVKDWLKNVDAALQLQPEHLSMYALTVEDGTPLKGMIERGELPVPDDDLAAEMYETASEIVETAGYLHYEISNWALAGRECRHNLTYWRDEEYYGIGAGAAGYANKMRVVNVNPIDEYIRRMSQSHDADPTASPAADSILPLSPDDEMQELMMVGLRLVEEGISQKRFAAHTGVRMMDRFGAQIERLIRLGLLEWAGPDGDILRLTRKAYLLGNQVFMEFVGE
jgi:oxygen-independent coproporphyrinogen-3 oxidase